MRQSARLLDRQRVHVRAQTDRAVRSAPRQGRHHPGAAGVRLEWDTHLPQPILHECAGFAFVQSHLRVRVQMSAPLRQPLVQVDVHQDSHEAVDASGLNGSRQCRAPRRVESRRQPVYRTDAETNRGLVAPNNERCCMRGLILAAGRQSLAADGQPTIMTNLAGKTLLDRQIAALRSGGVTEVGVIRGYHADAVTTTGITWFDHPRWAETGQVMALSAAAEWLR